MMVVLVNTTINGSMMTIVFIQKFTPAFFEVKLINAQTITMQQLDLLPFEITLMCEKHEFIFHSINNLV